MKNALPRRRPTSFAQRFAALTLALMGVATIRGASASACPLYNASTGRHEVDSQADLAIIESTTACRGNSITVFQIADITVSGSWTAIGDPPNPFSGTYDGQGNSIIFSGLTGLRGVFNYTTNATIQNLNISAVSGSTLADEGGWLVRFSTGGVIDGVSSNGPIPPNGGGIVGASSLNVTVRNSYSTGIIAGQGGGIIGQPSTGATVSNSFSTGSSNVDGGGILAKQAANATVTNSFSIAASLPGGLVAANSRGTSVSTSYSTASIGATDLTAGAGGIFSAYADLVPRNANSVTNSFTTGNIYTGGGGIVGRMAPTYDTPMTVTNSYSTGNIGSGGGGIGGEYSIDLTVNNSYSTGAIGSDAGGIIARDGRGVVNNAYTVGTVNLSGGGIVGWNSPATASSSQFENGAGWSDANARTVLTGTPSSIPGVGSVWGSCTPNTPFFLVAFYPVNPCEDPQYFPLTVSSSGAPSLTTFTAPANNTFTLVNQYRSATTPTFISLVNGTGSVSVGGTSCAHLLSCRLMDFVGTGGYAKSNVTVVSAGTVTVQRLNSDGTITSLGTITINPQPVVVAETSTTTTSTTTTLPAVVSTTAPRPVTVLPSTK
jgi:hypothetical protein